jgi:hypothetical protein
MERCTSNPQVAGSIPAGRTKQIKHFQRVLSCLTSSNYPIVRISVRVYRVYKDTVSGAMALPGYELNELYEIRVGERIVTLHLARCGL